MQVEQADSRATAGPQQIPVRALERLKVSRHESPLKGVVPLGLSHHQYQRPLHKTQCFMNSHPDPLQHIPGPTQHGISPGNAGSVARNGSIQISAPHPRGTMACVSLGGPSCHTRPQPPSEHSPSCSLWPGSGGAAGISCHRLPSPPGRPHGGRAAPSLIPGIPQGPATPRGQTGTRGGCCPSAGRWPCSKGTPAAPRTPPLCTSCWKRFPFCCSKPQLK